MAVELSMIIVAAGVAATLDCRLSESMFSPAV
jgi:hypothetical protein